MAGLLDERRRVVTRLSIRGRAAVAAMSCIVAALVLCVTIRPARADDPAETPATADPETGTAAPGQPDSAPVESPPDNHGDARPAARKPTDALGDPLPEGASLRLGTTRFRHPASAYDLALSPDEQSVVTIGHSELILWNTATGEERWRSDHAARHFGMLAAAYGTRLVGFSPDGTRLYSVGDRDELVVWQTASGRRETIPLMFADERAGEAPAYRSVDVSPGGETIALGGAAGVIVCDANGQVRYQIGNSPEGALEIGGKDRLLYAGHYSTARFAPDGRMLAAVTSDSPQVLRLCDAASGNELRRIPLSARLVRMAFSPDGRRIVATERDDAVRLYEVDSAQAVWSHTVKLSNPYETYTSAVEFSPDGTLIAAGATDNRIYLLDAATGDEVGRLEGHGSYPWGLAFTADGRKLYSAGWDGSVRRWDVGARKQLDLPAAVHATGVVAASPDGRLIAYGRDGGAVEIVRTDGATQHRTIPPADARYSQLTFSPDSRRLAGGGAHGDQVHVALWNVADGELLRRWDWPKGRDPHSKVERLDFTPDGAHLAAAVFRQSSAYVWNVTTGEQVSALPHSQIYGLSFSPDGTTLATAGWDKTIRFWETGSGKLQREYTVTDEADPNADTRLYAVQYAPQGGLIAAGDLERRIHVWQAESMALKTRCDVAARYTYRALEFSPDGLWLAAAARGGKVSLWDAATGQEVWKNTDAHGGDVYTVGFGRDSRTLVSGGRDGVCYLWDLRPPEVQLGKAPALLWNELAGQDAGESYRAMWALSDTPDRTVALLAEKLRPVRKAIDPERVRTWITDLDSEEFETRRTATAELARLGEAVSAPLREALTRARSAEQRGRLERLLRVIDSDEKSLAARRAVSLLGWLGTPAADRLLKELSQEDPEGVVGRAAAAIRRD